MRCGLAGSLIRGIISRGVGGLYAVRPVFDGKYEPGTELLARARGSFRIQNITPLVGDVVTLAPADEMNEQAEPVHGTADRRQRGKKGDVRVDWVISEISGRKNSMIRPPLANLDYLFAVIPAASPEPDLLTVDKLTVIAENYGIESVIIVNKADLDRRRAAGIADIYSLAGYRVFTVSAETGDGMDGLAGFLGEISESGTGKGYVSGAFAGASGAGKSTLMTHLFPELGLATGAVSRKTERGRHTTRHVELYPTDAGNGDFWLADTPGFSLLDFTRFNFLPTDELPYSFREFADSMGKCRYRKCTHTKEEGCAVLEKLSRGEIPPSRHESYMKILEEQRSVPEWKRKQM